MSRPDGAEEPWQAADAPLLTTARRAVRAAMPADLLFRCYFTVLGTPVLSELYVRSRGRLRRRRIQAQTRIVIEAYPSSGSTYCRQSLLLANPLLAANQVCSHTHSPRIVMRAVRAAVPCIVIARDPRDAVSSEVQRRPGVNLISAFRYYERYYRKLLPLRSEVIVASFDEVASNFSSVIDRVNDKYATDFVTEIEAGITKARVFADIDRRTRLQDGGHIDERKISRPTTARTHSDDVLAHMSDLERQTMEFAQTAYATFAESWKI